MSKIYNMQLNVGKVKYVVNFHDGVKTHLDGSPFFDIKTFKARQRRDLEKFERNLIDQGYSRQPLNLN
jgi:hypothetical protein